jgi:allantoinase
MAEFLVCTGSKVLLPEGTDPVPATVIVDRSTGKIIDVRQRQISREQLPLEPVEWIDAGDNIVLPGLVEYGHSFRLISVSDTLIFDI